MAEYVKLQHRLALRLARYSVIMAFIIGLLLSSIQVFDDFRDLDSRIDETIRRILVASSPPATRAVSTLDNSLAEEVVSGLLQYAFISGAVIKDELGKTLAQAKKEQAPSNTRWLTDKLSQKSRDYRMALQTPEYVGGGPGHLELQVNMDEALKPFLDRSLTVLLSGVVRNIILALLLMVIFYLALTRPLERLSRQFLRAKEKLKHDQEKTYHLRVASRHSSNELGLLCDAGNQFIETVQQLLVDKDQASKALKTSELRLLKLIDRIPQLLVAQNQSGNILFANQQFADFFGQPIKSIRSFDMASGSPQAQAVATEFDVIRQETLTGREVLHIHELTLVNHHNHAFIFSVQAASFEHFTEPATLIVANDISEQVKAKERIAKMASHDTLTGLPNRMLLNDRLTVALAACQRNPAHNAVLFLDLDHFKYINDSQGHEVGDEVLKTVARILTNTVRSNDTVARLGGDEFVILLQNLTEDKQVAVSHIRTVCDKIIKQISQPVKVGERTLHIGVSVGIVMFPMSNTGLHDLLRYADTAMYQAKAQGRNQAVFYQQDMSLVVEQRHVLENDLHQALKLRQFEIYYQPQLDKDGEIFGFEALIRWHHPKKGIISPNEFIPVLESGGMILPVGEWVFETCCAEVARWRELNIWRPWWHLAINVSPMQFYQENFIDMLAETVRRNNIECCDICIEITESVAIENVAFTASRLKLLRTQGFSVALDDFGTGYSSLSYLKNLPMDVLKIDRCFIIDLENSEKDRAIMRAINGVAQSLSLLVIAEGIETRQQLDICDEYGCQYFQGYYFYKPLSGERMEQILTGMPQVV